MKKIKNILMRKWHFIYWSSSPENFADLENDFFRFVFETPELVPLLHRIILNMRIDRDYLVEQMAIFVTRSTMIKGELQEPLFYSPDFHKKMPLSKNILRYLQKYRENHFTNEDASDPQKIEASIKSVYTHESRKRLELFQLSLLEEIDLQDTAIYKKEENTQKSFTFKEKEGVLLLMSKEISLAKNKAATDALLLMRTLVKQEKDAWCERGDIYDDWGLTPDDFKVTSRGKIYQASMKINQAVQKETGISDFIEATTKRARINPKYR